jgi:hypothetical protein
MVVLAVLALLWIFFPWTPALSPDLASLLGVLGSVMGAVFTVGGLVLALSAVLAQLSLEERTRSVVKKQFDELLPQFTQKVDARIEWLDAVSSIEPFVPGGGTPQSGKKRFNFEMWKDALDRIHRSLATDPTIPTGWSRPGLLAAKWVVGGHYNRFVYGYLEHQPPGVPSISSVIRLLENALAQGQDEAAPILSALSFLNLCQGDTDAAMSCLRMASQSETQRKLFVTNMSLKLWINAFASNRPRLGEVCQILGTPLGLTQAQITNFFSSVPPGEQFVRFIVERP